MFIKASFSSMIPYLVFLLCGSSLFHHCSFGTLVEAFYFPFPTISSRHYCPERIIDKNAIRQFQFVPKLSMLPLYPRTLESVPSKAIGGKETSTALFANKLDQRQARRDLPKRRSKRNNNDKNASLQPTNPLYPQTSYTNTKGNDSNNLSLENSELRPLILSQKREAGVDYWIDPYELMKQKERENAWKSRPKENQITQEKLWTEVLSPYKQNWIGYISVVIVVIAFIIKNFPEVMNPPLVRNIPDFL